MIVGIECDMMATVGQWSVCWLLLTKMYKFHCVQRIIEGKLTASEASANFGATSFKFIIWTSTFLHFCESLNNYGAWIYKCNTHHFRRFADRIQNHIISYSLKFLTIHQIFLPTNFFLNNWPDFPTHKFFSQQLTRVSHPKMSYY